MQHQHAGGHRLSEQYKPPVLPVEEKIIHLYRMEKEQLTIP